MEDTLTGVLLCFTDFLGEVLLMEGGVFGEGILDSLFSISNFSFLAGGGDS